MTALVIVNIVGVAVYPRPSLDWPSGLPIPREGEAVDIGGEVGYLYVRSVAYHPVGFDDDAAPYVYVVLGSRMPA